MFYPEIRKKYLVKLAQLWSDDNAQITSKDEKLMLFEDLISVVRFNEGSKKKMFSFCVFIYISVYD